MAVNRYLRAFVVMVAPLVCASVVLSQGRGGTVSGVVRSASAEPKAGAMVKVRNNDLRVTFTVISRAQGRYRVSDLPSGKYTLQAIGGGFQADLQSVQIDGRQSVTRDLTLSTAQNFQAAATTSDFAQLVSNDELRSLLIRKCTDCHHSLERIVPLRLNREGWKAVVEKMRDYPYKNLLKQTHITRRLELTDQQRDEIVDILAANLGPTAPPPDGRQLMSTMWVPAEAANVRMVEYDVTFDSGPHDVTVDSRGIAWVNEWVTGFIGRVDPVSHAYTRIEIPPACCEPAALPNAIAVDDGGRLWFEGWGNIAEYDPGTNRFAFYPFPQSTHGNRGKGVNGIRFLPGVVWAANNGGDRILRLDPKTKKFTEYVVPSTETEMFGATPYSLGIDGNHNIWFTERSREKDHLDKVGEVDVATGKVTEYDVPTRGAVLRRMSGDAEGNIWFGELGGVGKLGMIDYRTKKITEYPTPTRYSGAYSVSVDTKHDLIWVNEMMADKIAKFDPRTRIFVEYPLPTHFQSIRRIEVDPNRPNRVWYSGLNSSKVGYIELPE